VIELEFGDHKQTLLDGKFLLFLPHRKRTTSNRASHHGSLTTLASLLLPQQAQLVRDERVKWDGLDGDFRLWQDMEHVELIRHRALLADRENLEPAETLCLLKHVYEIIPLFTGQRIRDINLKALQVGLVL